MAPALKRRKTHTDRAAACIGSRALGEAPVEVTGCSSAPHQTSQSLGAVGTVWSVRMAPAPSWPYFPHPGPPHPNLSSLPTRPAVNGHCPWC